MIRNGAVFLVGPKGAVPSTHKPAVALAVIQPAPEAAGMGSFGNFAIEAAGEMIGMDGAPNNPPAR